MSVISVAKKPLDPMMIKRFVNFQTVLLLLVVMSIGSAAQINLLSKAKGARVVSFNSNYPGEELNEGAGWDVSSLVAGVSGGAPEDLPVWCTGTNAPFPHIAVIELPKAVWLTTFVFNNFIVDEQAYPGISARGLRLEMSTTGPHEGYETIASFELERNKNNQEVRITPQQARWIKIVITSNWGNPTWTELGQLSAYDDGSRPADLGGQLKRSGMAEIYGIYFDFASATLRPESNQTLEQIAALLRNDDALQFIVEGHTDDRGDAPANQALSEARAQAVCRALADMGIAAGRLEAVGYGESRPISSNENAIGRAQNRRVTLRVKPAG